MSHPIFKTALISSAAALLTLGILITLGYATDRSLFAQSADPVVVAFGDSLTAGVGATSGNDWVSLISDWSGINVVNEGVSGNTTENALARVNSEVIALDPDLVIVFLGGNDILQGVPKATTFANLGTIIDRLKASGAEVILVAEHGQFFAFDRENEFMMLALDKEVRYVPNTLEGILGDPRDLSDAVHPNDRGYRTIAERIFEEYQDALNDITDDAPLFAYCEPTSTEGFVDQTIRWKAFAWGGDNEGTYRFDWDGTNGLSGSTETIDTQYDSSGTKRASVAVTSGSDTVDVDCAETVTIADEPLVGACEARISILPDFSTGTSTNDNEVEVTWRVKAAGGERDGDDDRPEYEFTWEGTDGLSASNTDRVKFEYTSPGVKSAEVTIEASGEDLTLECDVELTDEMFESERPLYGGCSVSPGSFSIEDRVNWSAFAVGDGAIEYEWSGTNSLMSSSSFAAITYPSPGTKTATVEISDDEDSAEISCQIEILETPLGGRADGTGSGCFIATAAFGTELAPEVRTLRTFRDETLSKHALGRQFIKAYYQVSPSIANVIEDSETLKAMTRSALYPIIGTVKMIEWVRG